MPRIKAPQNVPGPWPPGSIEARPDVDEATIRDWLAEAFATQGYEPHVAENAQEAMRIFDREDIYVVLDLKLFGMNGIELCRKMRRASPLAVIYAMTGWGALFEVEQCREAGFDDYFIKPIDTDMILHVASDAFAKTVIIYSTGRPAGNSQAHEDKQTERAWEMLNNIITDTRGPRQPRPERKPGGER